MLNPYQTRPAKIVKIIDQAPGIKLFEFKFEKPHLKLDSDEDFYHKPGQFIILSLPGFGEAPFAPCNKPGDNLHLCVRAAGKLTNKLHALKIGDKVAIRGPYGNGWPVLGGVIPVETGIQVDGSGSRIKSGMTNWDKKNLLIVVGGLGLIPLRSLILARDIFLGKDSIVQIFYGAKTPNEFLFKNEFESWRKNGVDLQLTIDKECDGWKGCVGLVTTLFDRRNVVEDAKALLCGPPIMYKFVLQKVKEKRFKDEDIYLSLERRMHCGIGVCQHCAVGSHYTCKNGPVFQYSQIKGIQSAI